MRRIYWIVISLSILSVTLASFLISKCIELNKWCSDIPTEEFHKMAENKLSYHINDYRNYGAGQTTYDKERGLFVREVVEGDFYFVPKEIYEGNKKRLVFIMNLFNYGENYSIFRKVKDDFTIPLTEHYISGFRFCLLDKSSVFVKKNLYNNKYGEAGLTDITLDTYIPESNNKERIVHHDVFVTPLALKYIHDEDITKSLVFLQLLKPGPNEYSPDVVFKEIIAVGDYINGDIIDNHPDMIYYDMEIDREFIKEYVKKLLRS